MEIKTGISLQTKQQLSQLQVESLNILAMSMTELKDFLQNEEIENPLVEYTSGKDEAAHAQHEDADKRPGDGISRKRGGGVRTDRWGRRDQGRDRETECVDERL